MAEIEQVLRGYEADIAKLQAKLREARARQNAIASRLESAVTRAKARELLHGSRTEDAFSRFEILERRADFAEGRADALGLTGPKSLEEEIAELKAAEKVDAELEAMKAALAARRATKKGLGTWPNRFTLFAEPPRREAGRRLLDAWATLRHRPDVHPHRLGRRRDPDQLGDGAGRLRRRRHLPAHPEEPGDRAERAAESDFERMDEVGRGRPSVHAMRTELDATDRRLMAIDHHLNTHNARAGARDRSAAGGKVMEPTRS